MESRRVFFVAHLDIPRLFKGFPPWVGNELSLPSAVCLGWKPMGAEKIPPVFFSGGMFFFSFVTIFFSGKTNLNLGVDKNSGSWDSWGRPNYYFSVPTCFFAFLRFWKGRHFQGNWACIALVMWLLKKVPKDIPTVDGDFDYMTREEMIESIHTTKTRIPLGILRDELLYPARMTSLDLRGLGAWAKVTQKIFGPKWW